MRENPSRERGRRSEGERGGKRGREHQLGRGGGQKGRESIC